MFKIRIRKHEAGLWFRHGDFHRLLTPGKYFLPGTFFGKDRVHVVNTLDAQFTHGLLETMITEPSVQTALRVINLEESQRALVWKDGRLFRILGPGLHAFWKRPHTIEIELFDAEDIMFHHVKLDAVLAHKDARQFLMGLQVEPWEQVIVYANGKEIAKLPGGQHAFWSAVNITWKSIDLRERMKDITGQEIMTVDKVTLRVNLAVTYRIYDVDAAIGVVDDYEQALYREAQFGLRTAIGTRTLESLLTEKDAVATEVQSALQKRAKEFGVQVIGIGIRDVILPGDMKTILNQVIEAQKQAEANLIRRREETAAARSQANTARLLAENPVLLEMKQFEALQDILRGANATFVLGKGSLADELKSLVQKNGRQT